MQGEQCAALSLLSPLMGRAMPGAIAEKVFNLAGGCTRFLGRAEDAVTFYAHARDAAQERELRLLNASNVLFNRHYLPQTPLEERAASEEYGTLLLEGVVPFIHAPGAKRGRLRIGYLSPDVREHVVLSFSYALFTALDTARFEVYVYAMNREDAFTAGVRRRAACFRNLLGCTAQEAARRIHEDRIDILFDLAGHTAGGTLPVLAYRPAPVQMSGIGYFASTGLKTVDYFLADPVLAAGHAQEGFIERLLVLPQTHFCWQPLRPAPPAAHLPAAGRPIVFGSLNNFTKINDQVLKAWAEILRRVPTARLLLKTEIFSVSDGAAEARRRIAAAGIPPERVETEGVSPDYLAAYRRIDIALDTFPYPGGGTTCDALYMGVPVVTLAGETLGSRFGASLLQNIGAEVLIAHTEEEYIERAVFLAQDTQTLDALHAGLRRMTAASPVMDAATYGAAIGAAYEAVWAEYTARTCGHGKGSRGGRR
ncbi:hypothetical protein [uncultured Selenomonas sp.]|uniref:O-linked N-acetylglucosamine transferase, SPINDLY family protein n=1 Tax=uncultured Selenomonas sp. TaxID=159275 RepID=UPI00258394B6|nr:hypothetical protein [uncultured Selenomonas sp.]